MTALFLVMLGGALGAAARWGVGQAFSPSATGFPWSTMAINLAGGLAMGVVAGLIMRGVLAENGRLFAAVGLLGGFTTFSAFGLETLRLVERGEVGSALAYAGASVVGAVAMTALGLAATRLG